MQCILKLELSCVKIFTLYKYRDPLKYKLPLETTCLCLAHFYPFCLQSATVQLSCSPAAKSEAVWPVIACHSKVPGNIVQQLLVTKQGRIITQSIKDPEIKKDDDINTGSFRKNDLFY